MATRNRRASAAAACAVVAALAVVLGAAAATATVPGLTNGLGSLGAYDPWATYVTGLAAGSALAASPAYDASPYKTAAASYPAPSWAPSWSIFSEEPSGWLWQDSGAGGISAYHGTYDSAIIRFDSGSLDGSAGASWADGDSRRYLVFGSGSWTDRGNAASSAPSSAHSSPSSPPSPAQPRTLQDGTAQRPGGGFFTIATLHPESASDLSSRGFVVIPDRPLDWHAPPATAAGSPAGMPGSNEVPHLHVASGSGGAGSGDATGILDIVGLGAGGGDGVVAAERYGATGSGVTIAIVDTGVDFSNPDIQHALARDPITNHPVMLDPDGQGVVITNSTFYASISDSGTVRNHAGEVPEGFDSVVYVAEDGGVYLDIERGGRGTTIPVYNSLYPQIGSAPVLNGTLDHDMRIGLDDRDYIRSQSGAYRLGAMFQMGAPGLGSGPPPRIQVVPVLVVDSARPGVYDTIIPDMSTSWQDYTREQSNPELDFDFTDDRPVVLGSGGEFLTYDSDGDGTVDYTAGTAGARVLDVFAVMNDTLTSHQNEALGAVNGTLLPGLDPDGRFFGVMTDYGGHGTASSATIVSAGKMTYDIYNDTGSYVIGGVAPDARILPVKALWLGDALYGWLWAAGFDNEGSAWSYSGAPRADIISNSWGVSTFPNVGAAPGHDMLSLVVDMLSVPRSFDDSYPGVVVVSSAGNSGHGYGTLGTPGASSFGISAGASTNNVFVGYGPFKDQPRFGGSGGGVDDNSTGAADRAPRSYHRGHVVDFSGRGPGIIGDVRPDMVSVGAYGFVPRSMMGASQNADTRDPFALFGGTSMAGPAIAGAAAVVMSEMTKNQIDYDPFVIKNVLMSTARDMGNDPFVQGAGLADAGAALGFVHKEDGIFAVHNDGSYQNIRGILRPAISSANITDTGIGKFDLPDRDIPMTAWFAGHLQPGSRAAATFTIENPGPGAVDVSISPQKMSLVSHTSLNGTTVPRQHDPALNDTDAYIPNYVRLADVRPDEGLAGLFGDGRTIPAGASLLVLSVNFAFSDFMNMSADVYADDIGIASLYLYDWVDRDGDMEITSDELLLVTRGGSWGTVQEIRVSDPADKFEGVPMAGIYPVPLRYSYWVGPNGANATALDYTVSASYYAREKWEDVWPARSSVSVPPQDSRQVDVTLIIPDDAGAGIHHGFVSFEGDRHTANVPVSFAVTPVVHDAGSRIVFGGGGAPANASGSGAAEASPPHPDVTYSNGHTRGAFDMVGRYMAGDWRHHHFEVADPAISAASVRISWESEDTSVSAFVADPAGRIIQTNVPSGVFGHFLDWPSVDWLGSTPFSEGGGFYPVSGDAEDASSTFMTVPINGTGTYAIMTHTTLYGGDSVTEPMSIEVRFYGGGGEGDGGGVDVYGDNGAGQDADSPGSGTGAGSTDPAAATDGDDNDRHDPDAAQRDTTADGAAASAPLPPSEPAASDVQLPPADDTGQPATGLVSAATAEEAGPGFGTGAAAGLAAGAAITAAVFIAIKRARPASVRRESPDTDAVGAAHGNDNDNLRSGHAGDGDGDNGDNRNGRYGAL